MTNLNDLKYKTLLLYILITAIINFTFAIVPHWVLKPYWVVESDSLLPVTLFESIFTLLILPISLLKINKIISEKLKLKTSYYLIISLCFILIAIFLSDYFHFKNWGDMTGKTGDPDYGTKILRYILLGGGILIVVISILLQYFKQKRKK